MKPQDVRRVAQLARLRLRDDEVETLTAQFGTILGHLESLRAVPTEGVEPLDHPLPLQDVLRNDVAQAGLGRDEALAAAPERQDGFFRAPPVLAPAE